MAGIPVVGRSAELTTLREVVQDTAEGYPRLALVEGEAGMGKTRLLDEASSAAEHAGVWVVRGGGHALERERPFGVVADALKSRSSGEAMSEEMAALLLGGLDPIARFVDLSPGSSLRFRVVEAVVELLERDAHRNPVLVILDDLHLADFPTLLVLERLARRLGGAPVSVIGAYQPALRPESLDELRELFARHQALRVHLQPLAPEAVVELLVELLGASPGPRLLEYVGAACGNPLFVIELVNGLQQEARISASGEGVDISDEICLPISLRATILSRLRFLAEDTIEVLRVASLFGSPFSFEELAAGTAKDLKLLVPAVNEAVVAGILGEAGDRLCFRHELVRQAVYTDLPLAVRKGLHTSLGHALAGVSAPATKVAVHMALGAYPGDTNAVQWLRRGAADAARCGPRIAAGFLRQALELAGDSYLEREALVSELLRALLAAGWLRHAEELARQVLDRHHDGAQEVSVRRVLSQALFLQGRTTESLAELETAARLGAATSFERARLLAEVALRRVPFADLQAAQEAGEKAVAAAEEVDDGEALAVALCALSSVEYARGYVEEALVFANRAVHIAAGTHGEADRVAHLHLGLGLLLGDRLEEAEEVLEVERRLSERLGTWPLPVCHINLGTCRLFSGRWDDAVAEFETALALGERVETRSERAVALTHLAYVRVHRGDVAAADQALCSAQEEAGQAHGYSQVLLGCAQALVAEARGEPDAAFSILKGLAQRVWSSGSIVHYRWFGPDLVRLAIGAGDKALALSTTEALEEVALRSGLDSIAAAGLRCRGLVEGDADALVRSAQIYRRRRWRLQQAQACEEAALQLAADGRGAEALSLLKEAVEGYETLRADWDIARAEGRLRSMGLHRGRRGSRKRPSSGWEALTDTETRVVQLVAEGLTNPEIAARLFISKRTVATHLAHVFAKLGISSRVELATSVIRRAQGTAV